MTGGVKSFIIQPSTELLVGEAAAWTVVAPLPNGRMMVRAVTIDNKVFLAGK